MTLRLEFPPSYAGLVGVYSLFTEKTLYKPAWGKCKHATRRGAILGAIWAFLTFSIQKKSIELFLAKCPMFGCKISFNVHTYAAIMILGSQITQILRFFLNKNIRIARDCAWDQTVASRGKGPYFWQPYIEEWKNPPKMEIECRAEVHRQVVGGWFKLFVIAIRFLLGCSSALETSHFLQRRYFASKKITKRQVAVFMEERKRDYRVFGFIAALLGGIPIIGLVFTVSNRVGAAMWAHDLEKRQHVVTEERLHGRASPGSLKTE
ncbi:hypothetical protein BDZ97DRAFT_1908775 [Flammula alnicola]|nr:hypothetical protein BDZ97DRAFT_1908775 [Flammula alnicola]